MIKDMYKKCKEIFEKNIVNGLDLPDIKIHCKATVIKGLWH